MRQHNEILVAKEIQNPDLCPRKLDTEFMDAIVQKIRIGPNTRE